MGGALFLGGSLVSTAASLLNSDRQEKQYYNSLAASAEESARQTQEAARRNAGYLFEDAAWQNSALNRDYAQVLGQQKAALAASGLGGSSATAQLILKNSRLNALMDQEMLQQNMQRSIYENNTQAAWTAQQYRTQAQQYRRAKDQRRYSLWARGGSTLGGWLNK